MIEIKDIEKYLDLMNDNNYKDKIDDIINELPEIDSNKIFYLCCAYGYFNYPELFETILVDLLSRSGYVDLFDIILNIIAGQENYWGKKHNRYAIYAIGDRKVILAYNYHSAFDIYANKSMKIILKYISIETKELFYKVINKYPPIHINYEYSNNYKYNNQYERKIIIKI